MSARIFALAFVTLGACGLSACGLHPLYADSSVNGASAAVLDSIYVDPIDGEIAGYELRNSLIDALHSPEHSIDAKYRLKIEIKQTIQAISVENNASITRYNYVLQGKYVLTDAKGTMVKQGIENTLTAYDVVASPYATLAAQHDAQRRGARDLAYRVQVELAVFLANRHA